MIKFDISGAFQHMFGCVLAFILYAIFAIAILILIDIIISLIKRIWRKLKK